ncbi:tryptophan RNA-binding attenuator protein-like domain-containing protein [Fomes fomentarius]|nr:tryptophan RNA-binding attenuator protein-like domain-containing protein [Fomes fomentarius]
MSYAPNYPQPGYPGAAAHGHGSHAQGYAASAPHPQASQPQGAANVVTTGQVEGAQFRVDHRDSNSMLYLRLQSGYQIKAKPGSMVAMDATVQIKGKLKFSVKKIFTGGEMSESIFTDMGDIVPIQLDGRTSWSVGKDAFLACTINVVRSSKSQGLGKALFSGEGLFVYHVDGAGVMWVQSLGAITSRTLQPGEQWIVDNGHLVAWTAQYKVERIDAGGLFSASHTDEGLVCRFTGPGIVYIQTRNPETLGAWIADQVPDTN